MPKEPAHRVGQLDDLARLLVGARPYPAPDWRADDFLLMSGAEPAEHLRELVTAGINTGPDAVEATNDEADRIVWELVCRSVSSYEAAADERTRRELLAAFVLLGIPSGSFFQALTGSDDTSVWPPLNKSKREIASEAYGTNAGQITKFKPVNVTDRRVLAAVIHRAATNGDALEKTNYAGASRSAIRGLAGSLLDHVVLLVDEGLPSDLIRELREGSDEGHQGLARSPNSVIPGLRLPTTEMAVALAMALLVVLALVIVISDRDEDRGRNDGTTTAKATPDRTIPTPPAPGQTVIPATSAPEFSGTITANNLTTGKRDAKGWIEAAAGDELRIHLHIESKATSVASGVLLRTRIYSPPSDSRLRVVDFTVQQGEGGPEATLEGVRLAVEPPAKDSCLTAHLSTGDLLAKEVGGGRSPIPLMTTWSGTAQENLETVAQYSLPAMRRGETLDLSGAVVLALPDAPPQISGTSLRAKRVGAEAYDTSIEAGIGDTVRILIPLHNSSCTRQPAEPTVTATASRFDASRGFVTVSAVATGGLMNPRSTTFSAVRINITDGKKAKLRPLRETTKLLQDKCDGWHELEDLPDWLFQGGVDITVPGYIPRMKCDEHLRAITTDLEVAEER